MIQEVFDMKKLVSLISAAVMTAVMLCSTITASAASGTKPKLSSKKVYADQIILSVENAKSFPDGTSFTVTRSDRKITNVSKSFAATIPVEDCGVTYLKPDTAYTFTVTPVLPGIFTPVMSSITLSG